MYEEFTKKETKHTRYFDRLKKKGKHDYHIWMTPQEWQIVHNIAICVRQIKDINNVVGVDVSKDFLEYKIIMGHNRQETVLGTYDDHEIV